MNPLYQSTQYAQLKDQIIQFKNARQGIDPQREVMNLLQSGKISQADLNRAQSMANQIQQFLH